MRQADHAQSDPPESEQSVLTDFWADLYRDTPGYLGLFSGRREANRLVEVSARFFIWPEEADVAAEWATAQDRAGRDVYQCAHILTEPKRRKTSAAPICALYADLDRATIPEGVPQPSIVVESSPGRMQGYWLLSDTIDPARAEDLNRRLTAATGADPSGWDLGQLLRVPTTHNHKYADLPLVRIVQRNYTRFDSEVLDRGLPTRPPIRLAGDADEAPVRLTPAQRRAWDGLDAPIRDGAVDRSEALYRIGAVLYEAGASPKTIAAALAERDVTLGWRKYTDRPEQYDRIAAKVAAKHESGVAEVWVPATIRTIHDRLTDPQPIPHPLIRDLIWPQSITMLFGPTGVGKTTFLVNLALHAVTAPPSQGEIELERGLPLPTRRLRVLYIGAEDSLPMFEWGRLTPELLRHYAADTNLSDEFQYALGGFPLAATGRNPTDLDRFIQGLESRPPVDIIIFDPLIRFGPGLDENDNGDMGRLIAALDTIRERTGAAIVFSHHTGKAASRAMRTAPIVRSDPTAARGASVLTDRSHVAVSLVRGGGNTIAVTWAKANYTMLPLPRIFERSKGGVLIPVANQPILIDLMRLLAELVSTTAGGLVRRADFVKHAASVLNLPSRTARWRIARAEEAGWIVRVNADGEPSDDGEYLSVPDHEPKEDDNENPGCGAGSGDEL